MMKKLTGILISSMFLISAVWAAGGRPTVDSNLEKLGMRLYNDKNMSFNGTQSCRNCHHHFSGFADITNHLNPEDNFVSTGADGVSKGKRNAPSAAYAGYSPILEFEETSREWVGGMFWDGRKTGLELGDPLAEQAQGPPLNPDEMGMPDERAVIEVIKDSDYVNLWIRVFGSGSLDDVGDAYDNFGRAIAAYERSTDLNKFSSKFDVAQLSDVEQRGRDLFGDKCASCHSITVPVGVKAPLFTNYKYANIGVPANPDIPSEEPDWGLGAIVGEDAQNGKFKIPTLRNIALSAPYSHNGLFPTLKGMLEFINDRDQLSINDPDDFAPEVAENLSEDVGSLGLSPEELENIEAFLMTLTDDY